MTVAVASPPAVLDSCVARFEEQLQQRVRNAIDEEVRKLKEAFAAELQKAEEVKPPKKKAEEKIEKSKSPEPVAPISSGKSKTANQNEDPNRGGAKRESTQPHVSVDFKREVTTVFKKKQNEGEARVSLTRQSIKNGGEEVRKSLQRLSQSLTVEDIASGSQENPVPAFFKGKNGKPGCDIKAFTKALTAGEIATAWLDKPLETEHELPPPLFFATGQKNEKLVKLLVDHRADVRLRFQGEKMWNGVKKGMTALEAASNMKGRFIGTILEEKFLAIEEILRAEEDRLRGWKGGIVVARSQSATEAKARQTVTNRRSTAARNSESLLPEAAAEPEKEDEEGSDSEPEISAEEEAELEAKSKLYVAKGGGGGHNGKRKSLLVYVSKAAFVCEHVEGDPSESFELGDKVGEGTFGFVRKAVHKLTKVPRAIKTVPKMLLEDSGLWQEIEIMRELDHPHIMKIFTTYEDCENLYIILELCAGGDLIDALGNAGNFSEHTAGQLFKQMTGAVCYLHNQGICHRDLKPENFLLSMPIDDLRKVHVKLIDFGAARHFGPGQVMTTKICALHYVAPEIVSKKEVQYTEKCDIWSLGVILFLMLCGAPPFWGDDDMSVLKDIKKGRYVFEPKEIWDKVSKAPVDLIQKMLVVDPDKRAAMAQVAVDEKAWRKEIGSEDCVQVTPAIINNMRDFYAQGKLKKIALQVFAQQMSDESVTDLRLLFDSLDEGSTGSLSNAKLKDGMMRVGLADLDATEADKIVKEISQHSKTEVVNYSQFLAATLDRHQYLRATEGVRAAFNVFDMNNQNAFGLYEMSVLLSNNEVFAEALEEGSLDVMDLIEEADLNDDGKIDFDEFLEMMRAQPGSS